MRWNDVLIFCPEIAIFSQFSVYLSTNRAKQIINLLLLNHFYAAILYRRVQKKQKATNCCIRVRSLVMVRNRLPAQVFNLLRCNNVSRTSRMFLSRNCNNFSVSSILKYNPGKINLSLDIFYPVISYRQVRKRKKATNCCIRVRSLVMVRNQLPALKWNMQPLYWSVVNLWSSIDVRIMSVTKGDTVAPQQIIATIIKLITIEDDLWLLQQVKFWKKRV